jgi:hypothetical protein
MKRFYRSLAVVLVLLTAVSFASCKPRRNVKNLQAHLVTQGFPAEKFSPVKNFALKTALQLAGVKGVTTYFDGTVGCVIVQTKEPTNIDAIAATFGGLASSFDLSQVEGMGDMAPIFQSFSTGSVNPADNIAVHENFTMIHTNNSPQLVSAFMAY